MTDFANEIGAPLIRIGERLRSYRRYIPEAADAQVCGRLTRVVGLTLEAAGCPMTLGARCLIELPKGRSAEAEVVGFDEDITYLMPIHTLSGLKPGALVRPMTGTQGVRVGPGLLGRVLNGAGVPLDGKGPLNCSRTIPFHSETINPLARAPIREQQDVGIAAINSLLTVGVGQRLGLFAGSGVGKSMLLGMMTRFTTADVVVVGLIGERGREVKEFIEDILGEEGIKRAVVVASPADDSPLMRLRAAELTTRLAEYFRDSGKRVLMLMDSLTRYAQAQREIALSIGEPPATKGYPPSVFSKLPALVERTGNGPAGGGSITAFYTVLTEGDDQQDPIADASRAILDGHIVLNRRLAEAGHYPAIDIEQSISRVMPQVVIKDHLKSAQLFKQLYARYQQTRDLIAVGAYQPGSDPAIDLAIKLYPQLTAFLQQSLDEPRHTAACIEALLQLVPPTLQTAGVAAQPKQGVAPPGQVASRPGPGARR